MASQTTESKTCEVEGVDPFQMILQYMERHFTNQGDLLEQINQQLHEALMGRLGERVLVEPTGSGHADGGGSASLPASFLGSEASAEAPKTALPASRDMAMPKTATLKTPKMMGNPAPLRSGSNLSVTLPLPERSSERSRLRNSRNSVGSKESKDSLGLDSNLSAEHHHQQQSEEHLGTSSKATFVTQEIQRQERMARKAARKLTEQKLSSISAAVYWSQRPKDENWAHRIINSWWFVHFISTVIVVNMILLGIEVDLAAAIGQENVSPWYGIINATAVGIFVVELSLTFIALGIRRFFCGKDKAWNIFDFCIITLSVLETSTELWQQALAASSSSSSEQVSTSQLRFFRSVRLARALRGVRMVRLLRYVGALRTLVLSIASSMASLLWTLVLLVIIFYTFGIMFTQLVSDYCRYEVGSATMSGCVDKVGVYWSSLPESMLTLFMTISGGINWGETFRPLIDISIFAVMCHIIFITIAVLAVVNVVTGVFCSTAMESAAADKEIATMKQLKKKNAQLQDLRSAFEEIVDAESNTVNIGDFEKAMGSAKFRNFLESMSISTEDISTLFTIIDSDQSGLIDLEEFVQGCMQLHGPAKSLQLAKMSFENKITRQTMKSMANSLEDLKVQLDQWRRHSTPRFRGVSRQTVWSI